MARKLLPVVAAVVALAVGLLVVPAGADSGGQPFNIALSGANEVPENPHGAADSGSVLLTFNQGQGEVCWTFGPLTLTAGDTLPFAGHIHEAPVGVAGDIVLTLFGAPPVPEGTTIPATPTAYPTATSCVTGVDPALIKEIRKNPQDYYVNLHNTQHPTGAVRGQLG